MVKLKEKKPSTKASKKWEYYSSGSKSKKECPKCGKGVFMGEHKNPNRHHCGKCSHVVFEKSNN